MTTESDIKFFFPETLQYFCNTKYIPLKYNKNLTIDIEKNNYAY